MKQVKKKAKQSKKIKENKKLIKKEKKEVNLGGRPTLMTQEVLAKLREYFKEGMSDEKACYFSGIGVDVLYRYIKKNPRFREEKEYLKHSMVDMARRNVLRAIEMESINGQTFNSWKVLEKRDPEFLPKAVLQNEISVLTAEQKKMLDSLINE